ncbi:YdcF family protein [Butyrivibrio sp. INlla16]|uniref:YdcF family protein n=1 Tax=Butyrivibrio sp. INlla16 TaxID=1520807 RepID=UPI00088DC552|nr:YdcF family protein [Butyrivibrio sp. INlla16]SDB45951.1 Uncharacterized SAM-binding protein YcdF, DUF218 family [Butyrivibrio sp. INlla16]
MTKKNTFIRIIFLTLTAICLIYSVSIYLVASGTFSFVIWLAGAAFFAFLWFVSGKERWNKIPKALRIVMTSVIAIGVLIFIICEGMILSHFNDKGEENLDYIIVLGAQMRDFGPSIIFKYRLDAARHYLEKNPGTICIVSGAQAANEPVSEGEGGRDYLISLGIPENRVIAETEAVDTTENIAYSLEMIGDEALEKDLKIGIVTNNFHVFRGVHLATSMCDEEICGIAAYTRPWYLPNNMVRECFGIIRDFRIMF